MTGALRTRVVLASFGALAGLGLLAPFTPGAHAFDAVEVGAGQAAISAGVSAPAPTNAVGDSNSSTGLSFSDSVSATSSCGSANASQTSATSETSEGLSVTFDSGLGASYGSAGCGGLSDLAVGESSFVRDFQVTAAVPYTIEAHRTGSINAEGQYVAEVALTGPGAPGFLVGAPGTPCCDQDGEAAGTLFPGSYHLQVSPYRCRALAPGGACSGNVNVVLTLGDAAPPVVITSGPSGVVGSRNATFEFAAADPDPPPGAFQCQLDGQGFSTCTSPHSLSGLSEGQHTFSVRFDPDGADPPSAATTRTWTVDTTAPSVVFDSAPSGTVQSSTAEIAFHSTEAAGATFRCQLDGGAEFECASPHSLSGLSDGAHTFSVKATDQAGNTSLPASASWTVTPLDGPIDVGCTAAGASAGFGPVRLIPRTPDACFFDDNVGTSPVRVSRGQVSLNGITLTPAAGTRIIVAPALGGGTVRTDGTVTVRFGSPLLEVTLPSLELDNLGTAATGVNKILQVGEGVLRVAGMKRRPAIGLELSADNGGQAKVTFKLTLPRNFSSLPTEPPREVVVEFGPTFSNDRGVTGAGRIKLSQVYLFGQKVKELDLAYDHASGAFDGSLGIELGENAPTLTGSISLGLPELGSDLNCGVRKLGLVASDIKRPVGPGIFLQRFGGTFECIADGGDFSVKLTSNGGVSAGPKIELGSFEAEAASIDGTASLTLPVTTSDPFTLEAQGTGKIVDIPVAQQTITYRSPATVKLTGGVDFTAGGYGAQLTYGEQGTFISPDAFNIEAAGAVNLFGFDFGAQGVFSSTGFAICLGEGNERTGFGKRWNGELTAFTVCDVGPFRTAAPARAAQAGEQSFGVGAGAPLTVLAAEGDGAPPNVVLSGPNGERIETPAGGDGISSDDVLLVQDRERDTTFVVLFNPSAGRWAVAAADGSPGLARLRVARRLPPLRINAKVRRRGQRRLLTWNAKGLAGQRLELVERGNGGANLLTTTTRSSGRLRFKPDPTLGVRRTIEAVAYNGGTPRSTETVARYRVPPPPRPKRVRGLKLRRNTLSWRAQRAASSYEVALTLPDGTTTTRSARRARLRLSGLPRRGRLRVAIVGVNALGRPGRVAKARLPLRP